MATVPAVGARKKAYPERRTARRYQLSLPLAVLPCAEGLMLHEQASLPRGRARDISVNGIYFTTYEPLAAGSDISFTLVLPAELTRRAEVLICAQGKVVRSEKVFENGFKRIGVAATIESYEIVKEDPMYHELYRGKTQPWSAYSAIT
jgi:hypothetical protein